MGIWFSDLVFRAFGLGKFGGVGGGRLRVWGLGFWVLGFWVLGFWGFGVWGIGVWGLRFRDIVFRALGLEEFGGGGRLRVWDSWV